MLVGKQLYMLGGELVASTFIKKVDLKKIPSIEGVITTVSGVAATAATSSIETNPENITIHNHKKE